MYYNFCRVHATLTKAKGGIHTSLAMAAGLSSIFGERYLSNPVYTELTDPDCSDLADALA